MERNAAPKFAAGALHQTGSDFFRPSGPAFAIREKLLEVVRRVRRGGLIFILLVFSLLAYSLLAAPIGLLLWLIALPMALFAAALSLLWPTRKGRKSSRASSSQSDVSNLAGRAARWFERQRGSLPAEADAASEEIARTLGEISVMAGGPTLDAALAGESSRLIGKHLPNLVECYCALPREQRRAGSRQRVEMARALAALAAELGEVAERIAKARSQSFDVQQRFVALRFSTGDGLTAH